MFPNPNRTVDALVGVRWLVEITIWRGDKREPPTCCEGTQSLLFLLNDFSFSGWLHFRLRDLLYWGCFVGDFALQKMVVKPSGEWMPKEDLDDLNGCSYSDHSWGGSEKSHWVVLPGCRGMIRRLFITKECQLLECWWCTGEGEKTVWEGCRTYHDAEEGLICISFFTDVVLL